MGSRDESSSRPYYTPPHFTIYEFDFGQQPESNQREVHRWFIFPDGKIGEPAHGVTLGAWCRAPRYRAVRVGTHGAHSTIDSLLKAQCHAALDLISGSRPAWPSRQQLRTFQQWGAQNWARTAENPDLRCAQFDIGWCAVQQLDQGWVSIAGSEQLPETIRIRPVADTAAYGLNLAKPHSAADLSESHVGREPEQPDLRNQQK